MAGKWDDEANLKFISLYEQNQCLWKTDSPAYKNREAREMAINRVVGAMAIPEFRNLECKNKIKNVRSHYIQELKKIKKSRRRCALEHSTYEPKLTWFGPLDRFLRPHILTLTKAGGAALESSAPIDGDGGKDDAGQRSSRVTEVKEEASEEKSTDASVHFPSPEDTKELRTVSDTFPNQAGMPTPCEGFVENGDEVMSEHESWANMEEDWKQRKRRWSSVGSGQIMDGNRTTLTPEERDNEFEAFGRGIAAQLKNTPFSLALMLQLKIQALITEERLKCLKNNLQ